MADKAGGILATIKTHGITTDEKAMLAMEQFSQVPVFETWDGINDISQVLAPGLDDLTLMASRHPWASAWFLKEDTALSSYEGLGTNNPKLYVRQDAIGEVAQLSCLRNFMIGFTGQSYLGANDERLIFECILVPEQASDVAMDWFVGLANVPATTFLTTPELAAETTRRFGFAIDGDTNIYGISADGATGEVTSDYDLIATNIPRYLKAVYDIGTDIKFYVDSTLIGTLSTNLPTITASSFLFMMYIQSTDGNSKVIFTHTNKMRWQNGATP